MGAAIGKKKKAQMEALQMINPDRQKASEGRKQTIPHRERPDALFISCDATSPEWEKPDVFIFSKPFEYEQRKVRQGRFYSRVYRFVGSWRMEQNLLTMRWDGSKRVDVVRAGSDERHLDNPRTEMTLTVVEPVILPWWFTVDCLSKQFERQDIASQNFECGVCYFELYRSKVCVMRYFSRRCCEHYIHYDCARHLLDSAMIEHGKMDSSCPSCGSRFNEAKELPDMARDPRSFFQLADVDCGGELSQTEVLGVTGVVLPIPRLKLEQAINDHWFEWDPDNSGSITMKEFLVKDIGLRDFLIRALRELKERDQLLKPGDMSEVPSLETHPKEWFDYWDLDSSGTLELEEMVRAFIRSFCVSNTGEPIFRRAFEMRTLATAVWEELGFHAMDSIDFDTFMTPYGFGDTFVHNAVFTDTFGGSSKAF